MASGNPSPNFYSGVELTATTLDGNKGIYHGQDVTGQKVLKELSVQTVTASAVPITLLMCDYLLYYPQIDMDSVDPQSMDNTVTLPRYESGEGVRMFVVAQYPYIGGVNFSVSYTNSDGIAGRTTGVVGMNTATSISTFIHGRATANGFSSFLPLQSWDKGVRSVQSITFTGAGGGLGCIVLVKPIETITLLETQSPSETNYAKDKSTIPEIKNGAYLGFLALPNASIISAPIFGRATFVNY
jgi:hypothetical protein